MDDEALEDEADGVTSDEVAFFNREAMRDLAVWGRRVGMAVVIVGWVGAIAWLWLTIRTQQRLDSSGFTIGGASGGGPSSLTRRLDAVASTIGLLVSSALTSGSGMAVWLISNHVTVANGGTLSGVEEGDPFPHVRDPSDDAD